MTTTDDPPTGSELPTVVDQQIDTLAHFRAAAAAFGLGATDTLRSMIELGRIGVGLMREPWRWRLPEGADPDFAMGRMAKALGVETAIFRGAIAIVEAFSDAQLEAFLVRKSRRGSPITLDHVRTIAGQPSDGLRRDLIEYYYVDSPNPKQLAYRARHFLRRQPPPTRVPFLTSVSEDYTKMSMSLRRRISKLPEQLDQSLRKHIDRGFRLSPVCEEKVAKLREQLLKLQQAVNSAVEASGNVLLQIQQLPAPAGV